DREGVEVVPILREEREEERPHVLAAPPACPGHEVVFERRETRRAARRGDGQNRLGRVVPPGTLRAPPVGRLAEGLLRAGSSVPASQRSPGGALEEAV